MINTDRICMGCMNDNGGEVICPNCGYDAGKNNDENRLPVRFSIRDRFIIGRVISENSEGATYIAWDNSDDSIVNVREYYPSGVAVRNPDKTVSILKGSEYYYNEGLMEFMELHRKLADASLSSAPDEFSVFEENGTAYAVFRPVSGITLEDFLSRNGGMLKWEQARPLFLPLIDMLSELSEKGIVHGGISPETIIVGRDGKLRLTEFCISSLRTTAGTISSQLYPGFAATEQYGGEGMKLSEATDVYGLSATIFRVLIGITPPAADERKTNDKMSIPSHFADELPRQVLVALANGLQINPENRTATIDAFKNELVYGETAENARRAAVNRNAQADQAKGGKKKKKKGSSAKYAVISALCTALVFFVAAGILWFTVLEDIIMPSDDASSNSSEEDIQSPSVDVIGDYDSDAVESKVLYSVPDLCGQYYSKIIDNEEYERFDFVIIDKEFSTKYARGAICKQSIQAGTQVEKDTTIQLTVSLGPQEVKIPDVTDKDEANAKIELLKAGFLYENIEVVYDISDSERDPGEVLKQSPEAGNVANTDIKITIYINSYEGEDEEDTSSDSHYNE